MRTFEVSRGHDESGVSGTGPVMEGAVFGDGRVVLRWLSKPYSYVMWDRFEDMWKINIASHPSNETEVHFDAVEDGISNAVLYQGISEEVLEATLDALGIPGRN